MQQLSVCVIPTSQPQYCYGVKKYTNEAKSATTSSELKPASEKRAKMVSVDWVGEGTMESGAAAVATGRPAKNSSRGAPGQFPIPTAAASWMLQAS